MVNIDLTNKGESSRNLYQEFIEPSQNSGPNTYTIEVNLSPQPDDGNPGVSVELPFGVTPQSLTATFDMSSNTARVYLRFGGGK